MARKMEHPIQIKVRAGAGEHVLEGGYALVRDEHAGRISFKLDTKPLPGHIDPLILLPVIELLSGSGKVHESAPLPFPPGRRVDAVREVHTREHGGMCIGSIQHALTGDKKGLFAAEVQLRPGKKRLPEFASMQIVDFPGSFTRAGDVRLSLTQPVSWIVKGGQPFTASTYTSFTTETPHGLIDSVLRVVHVHACMQNDRTLDGAISPILLTYEGLRATSQPQPST